MDSELISALIGLTTFAIGMVVEHFRSVRVEKRKDRNEALAEAESKRVHKRQLEEDLAIAPIIEVISLMSDESGAVLTIANRGESAARDLSVWFDVGLASANFPFDPQTVSSLEGGKSIELHSSARPIHFLNQYLFGRGDVPLQLHWKALHLEPQSKRVTTSVHLPPNPTFPVVD